MDFFEDRNYVINKRLLFYTGMWPFQTQPEKLFIRTIFVGLWISLIIPKVARIWTVWGDLNDTTDCIPILCVDFVAIVKYLTWTIKHKQMRELLSQIEDTSKSNMVDHESLTNYAKRGRMFTISYAVYLAITTLCYLFMMPLIPILLDVFMPQNVTRDRMHLYEVEYFVSPEKYHYWILVHAYIAGPLVMVVHITYDTMFAVQVHHACGVFASVGVRLRKIRGRDNTRVEKHEEFRGGREEDYNDMVTCMKLHKHAVELSKLIESSNSVSMIFIIAGSVMALTVIGYTAMTHLDSRGASVRSGAFVFCEITHMWYLSWQGQLLLDHSVNILHDAYNVDFVDISISAKRLLILLMLRCSKPCTVTAGKIYVFSMESFAAALKTSMSYFTVLMSVQ